MMITINLQKGIVWVIMLMTILVLAYANVNHLASEISGIEEHLSQVKLVGVKQTTDCEFVSVGKDVTFKTDDLSEDLIKEREHYKNGEHGYCTENRVPVSFHVDDFSVIDGFLVKCCKLQIEYGYNNVNTVSK